MNNLINKLTEKWADFRSAIGHSKIAKRMAAITLAGAMVFPVALSLGACGKNNNVGPNGTQPGGDNPSTTQPGKKPNYSKYSKLLQDVLNNPEYDALYKRYESGELYENSDNYDNGVNILEAIPYAYLENTSEDVEGIKKGSVPVSSVLYSMDNDKGHIYNRLETIHYVDGGEKYKNQYLLKYQIKEDELEDLKMLYEGKYYQGPIMFQYLASQRKPEVIAEFSITEFAYNQLVNSLNKNEVVNQNFGKKVTDFTITDFKQNLQNEKNYDMQICLISQTSTNNVSQATIAPMSFMVHNYSGVQYINDIIDWTHINNRYEDSQIEVSTPITYFQIYINFKDIKTTLNK